MKDTDGLNDILGYARLVEGNLHSEHLGKVYQESVKTSNKGIEAVDKKNNKNKKFQTEFNDRIQNTDLNPETKRVVVTVGPNIHLSVALHLARSAIIVRKRTIFPICVEVGNIAKAVMAIDHSLKIQDLVARTIMN